MNYRRGFSLIELLVALSILAVVAAIIIPRFINVNNSAMAATANGQVQAIEGTTRNWAALGGKINGATPTQLFQFLCTPGVNTTSIRLAGNPARDNSTAMGSWYISLNTPLNTTAPAVEGFNDIGDANGLFYYIGGKTFRLQLDANEHWFSPDLP